MTNITNTFGLYTDSGLTTLFTGTLSFTHYTDLSDNGTASNDTVLYLGSTNSARQLEANSNPGVDNITISVNENVDAWAATTAYSLNDRIEPTTANGYVYKCTTAGTSAGSEPTWPTTGIGSSTVSDGTVVWTLVTAKHEDTEVKLATTSGGLAGATAGASLSLGTTISGGSGSAQEVHIRITNAVTNVMDNTGYPGLTLTTNEVLETVA